MSAKLQRDPSRFYHRLLACSVALLAVFLATGASAEPLTPDEKAWLKEHGPLRYAPDPAFAPFEFFRSNGNLAGITPEILSVLAEKLGTTIEPVRYPTWTDVLAGMKKGEADLLGTLTLTPERETFLLFTEPYLQVPYVLFVRLGADMRETIDDFAGRKVGVVRNHGAHAWIQKEHPELAITPVETTKEGLLLLSIGRLDAMVETLPVGNHVLTEFALTGVTFLPSILYTTPQHMAVAKTNTVLLSILNKGLSSIAESERSAIVRRWAEHHTMSPQWMLPEWARRAAATAAGILILLLIWIQALRRMVARQTRDLKAGEDRYRALVDNLPQRIFMKDPKSIYISCNRAYAADLGIQPSEIEGKTDFEFYPQDLAEKYRTDDRDVMSRKDVRDIEEAYPINGIMRIVHTVKTPVLGSDGKVLGVLGIFWDITELKRSEEARTNLEAQLRQSQKMEAIGRLAGGVAHDLNNILTVILGNASLMQKDTTVSSDAREIAGEIGDAATRAADLTRRLLTFSRRHRVSFQHLNLNEIVLRMHKILKPLLGESVRLVEDVSEQPPVVEADGSMMEQVIMNLVINARDAMPQGGTIEVVTRLVLIESSVTKDGVIMPPGRYARLSVSDKGSGMDKHTMEHLFEPFFTTKDVGQGTGLGLATVYGIVKQHKGWIDVESEPGKGSRFTIYIPACGEPAQRSSVQTQTGDVIGGKETILVVEDEASVRKMVRVTLQRLGYRVLEAENGKAALDAWKAQRGEIDLLLTDMVMPEEISGLDLARKLREQKPGLRVIVSSGYSDQILQESGELPKGAEFLAKPYDLTKLSLIVRRILDA